MLISLLVGTLIAIITIAIHAVGTSGWIAYLQNNENRFKTRFGEIKVLSYTAVALLLVHIVEVLLWGIVYKLLVEGPQFSNFEDAAYFSSVTFTSLGYGDIVLTGPWRMLCAIESMTGLLVFGWSTALLFAVVQRIWQHKYES